MAPRNYFDKSSHEFGPPGTEADFSFLTDAAFDFARSYCSSEEEKKRGTLRIRELTLCRFLAITKDRARRSFMRQMPLEQLVFAAQKILSLLYF